MKLIFKTIRTQNLNLQKIVNESIKRTQNTDNTIKSTLDDLNNMIHNLYEENNNNKNNLNDRINDISVLNTKMDNNINE